MQDALAAWLPVWVVIDGSTDGSDTALRKGTDDYAIGAALAVGALRVLHRDRNGGKGSAVRVGLEAASNEGFTHALVMDADGQHPAQAVCDFMRVSAANPDRMILGVPRFSADAPKVRVHGRKISNWWTRLETNGQIQDSLFGFRVYPIAPLLRAMRRSRFMRGYDFDAEAAVRLCWAGVRPINLPAPVSYPARGAGGVSHFRYGRDNALLTAMHTRLFSAFLLRKIGLFRQ